MGLFGKKKNPNDWTDAQRKREWGGRSDQDRKDGATDNAPWRSTGEISQGNFQDTTQSFHNVASSLGRSSGTSKPAKIDTRKLDEVIRQVQNMPDTSRNESTAEAWIRLKREQGWSDKKIEHVARTEFHSDKYPENRAYYDGLVMEIGQLLRRR